MIFALEYIAVLLPFLWYFPAGCAMLFMAPIAWFYRYMPALPLHFVRSVARACPGPWSFMPSVGINFKSAGGTILLSHLLNGYTTGYSFPDSCLQLLQVYSVILTYVMSGYDTSLWCASRRVYRALMPAQVCYLPRWSDYSQATFAQTWLFSDDSFLPLAPLIDKLYAAAGCITERNLVSDVIYVKNAALYNWYLTEYHLCMEAKAYTDSPVTFGVCPDDPNFWTYHFDIFMKSHWYFTWFFVCVIIMLLIYNILDMMHRISNSIGNTYNYIISRLVFGSNLAKPGRHIRSTFMDLSRPPVRPTPNHTHGTAAAERSADSLFCVSLADQLGRHPYMYQCSNTDQKRFLAGSRTYYWPKDLAVTPKRYEPPDNALIIMVDVDEYVDMPSFLAYNDKPVVLTTFQPTKVADSSSPDFSFTFDMENNVHYKVTGGGNYIHPVWNYSQDTISATSYLFNFIPWQHTEYYIDRRTTSPHHDIVLLTPIGRWRWFAALTHWFVSPTPLKRLSVVRGSHTRLNVYSEQGNYISTGRPGYALSATIPAHIDNAIALSADNAINGFNKGSVESFLQIDDSVPKTERSAIAMMLYDYHSTTKMRSNMQDKINAMVSRVFHNAFGFATAPDKIFPNTNPHKPVPQVRSYQFSNYDQTAKDTMYAYMLPILDGGFAPAATVDNEEAAVQGRIIDVKNTKPINHFLRGCINDFVDHIVHEKITPVDQDEVFKRQPRPAQRHTLDHASSSAVLPNIIKSFIKSESYPNTKDPRLISTYNAQNKNNYSKYIYAVADWMKTIPCYAFGSTPAEISQKVADICYHSDTIVKSDFSKFDGTVGETLRTLERCLLFALFPTSYHDEIAELHGDQFNLRAVCSLGTRYETGFARGSGSAETSAFNSICNMFVTYVAWRRTRDAAGVYYNNDSAFWMVMKRGIYGGDDGLSGNIDVDTYIKAAQSIGLNVKAEPILRGEHGVEFLARCYTPSVWDGHPNNMCDIKRQLGKFHLTTPANKLKTPVQILVNKAIGFYLSDFCTPILGPFCEKVVELARQELPLQILELDQLQYETKRALGDIQLTTEVQFDPFLFNNNPSTQYEDMFDLALPLFDRNKFDHWLAGVTTLEQLLQPPSCHPPTQPEPHNTRVTFVDGDLIEPKQTTATKGNHKKKKIEVNEKKSRKVRPVSVSLQPKVPINKAMTHQTGDALAT